MPKKTLIVLLVIVGALAFLAGNYFVPFRFNRTVTNAGALCDTVTGARDFVCGSGGQAQGYTVSQCDSYNKAVAGLCN